MKDILRKCRLPKAKSWLIAAIFRNPVYAIWKVRNNTVWHKKVMTIRRVVDTIKADSKIRFVSLYPNGATALWLRNRTWAFLLVGLTCFACSFYRSYLSQILVTSCVAFLRYPDFSRAHEEWGGETLPRRWAPLSHWCNW